MSVVTALFIVGCNDGGASSDVDTDGMNTESSADAVERVTYANFGDAFLRNWCRGCHGVQLTGDARSDAPEGIDFETHDDARMWADRIRARAIGEHASMPPAGGPSPEELALLEAWLDADVP